MGRWVGQQVSLHSPSLLTPAKQRSGYGPRPRRSSYRPRVLQSPAQCGQEVLPHSTVVYSLLLHILIWGFIEKSILCELSREAVRGRGTKSIVRDCPITQLL